MGEEWGRTHGNRAGSQLGQKRGEDGTGYQDNGEIGLEA